ncbi:MAG: tyrosine-type recombinase/integrase [Bacteroidota bacterium]
MSKTHHELVVQSKFFKLLRQFIIDSQSKKRLQKNGTIIKQSTIDTYELLYKNILSYCLKKHCLIEFPLLNYNAKKDINKADKYWKEFYLKFTDYLYKDLDCYDNYVGNQIKVLKVFFNYLLLEKNMPIGLFHKKFYVMKEDIPILVLEPEQLQWLIENNDVDKELSPLQIGVKNIFIVGCTVALRFSDLLALKRTDVVYSMNAMYIQVRSKKTSTFTSIKLPDYAKDIIEVFMQENRVTVFPFISVNYFNKNLKIIALKMGWNKPIDKIRHKRGQSVFINKKEGSLLLSDLISSHIMRRTAITTMLRLGMPEHSVRKISGHTQGSKEFYRYVELSQLYLDKQTDEVFYKLRNSKF